MSYRNRNVDDETGRVPVRRTVGRQNVSSAVPTRRTPTRRTAAASSSRRSPVSRSPSPSRRSQTRRSPSRRSPSSSRRSPSPTRRSPVGGASLRSPVRRSPTYFDDEVALRSAIDASMNESAMAGALRDEAAHLDAQAIADAELAAALEASMAAHSGRSPLRSSRGSSRSPTRVPSARSSSRASSRSRSPLRTSGAVGLSLAEENLRLQALLDECLEGQRMSARSARSRSSSRSASRSSSRSPLRSSTQSIRDQQDAAYAESLRQDLMRESAMAASSSSMVSASRRTRSPTMRSPSRRSPSPERTMRLSGGGVTVGRQNVNTPSEMRISRSRLLEGGGDKAMVVLSFVGSDGKRYEQDVEVSKNTRFRTLRNFVRGESGNLGAKIVRVPPATFKPEWLDVTLAESPFGKSNRVKIFLD